MNLPVGELLKPEVRKLAADAQRPNAERKDSQGICFLGQVPVQDFLERHIPDAPGPIVNAAGKAIGQHRGLHRYTIGQRKGIGLPGGGPKRYVVDVDTSARVVTVGADSDLLRSELTVHSMAWVDEAVSGEVLVQASAHGATQRAAISCTQDSVRVVWDEQQRRIAPGQSVVFYDLSDQRVLGGGIAD